MLNGERGRGGGMARSTLLPLREASSSASLPVGLDPTDAAEGTSLAGEYKALRLSGVGTGSVLLNDEFRTSSESEVSEG